MDNREIRLANLRYAIRFFGGVATLAEAANCSKKYLEQILQGFQNEKDKNPRKLGDTVAKKIAEALGEQPYWIDQPHPDLWADENSTSENIAYLGSKKHNQVIIKQYDTGGAMGGGLQLKDQPGLIHSWSVSNEWLDKNIKGFSSTANLCIVTGFGDSMRPMFNPGDPLIVDLGVNLVDFDSVYFFRVENEGFIKRLQRVPGKGLLAISENSAYRDWTIDKTMDFEVFGRVLKVWRSEEF
ncbi:MAG TPA: transcriptional regulator [Pusillimonas sp.]|mgnify:CR=1 FL=1|jgi:phage repressor protein C with HTH and peptisase S24 domain|nr:transcriptional regulator [Pusillimonas sp.]|tara:strand:- start:60859 stop:61578 length:720 start_codon:yes stop_codon:yes gene_type:complete